jgi:hypothetical protein
MPSRQCYLYMSFNPKAIWQKHGQIRKPMEIWTITSSTETQSINILGCCKAIATSFVMRALCQITSLLPCCLGRMTFQSQTTNTVWSGHKDIIFEDWLLKSLASHPPTDTTGYSIMKKKYKTKFPVVSFVLKKLVAQLKFQLHGYFSHV